MVVNQGALELSVWCSSVWCKECPKHHSGTLDEEFEVPLPKCRNHPSATSLSVFDFPVLHRELAANKTRSSAVFSRHRASAPNGVDDEAAKRCSLS